MSNYDPPTINSNIFNDSYFTSIDGALTIQTADLRYLKLTGGVVRGDTTFSSNLNVTNTLTVSTSLSTPIINSNQYLLAGASVLASALTSITPGTAAASKALVLDASSNIASIGSISQTIAAGSDFITLTSTSSTTRNTIRFVTDSNSMEFGSRSSASGSYPNSFYMYSGGAYRWTMNAATGETQIFSTSDASSLATGALRISGGLSVAKKIFTNDTLTIDRNGSHMSLVNGGNSALIEVAASPNILRLVNGYALNISSTGLTVASSSIQAARYAIDMQATVADIKLCLYQSASNGSYALGASGSALNVVTGGSSIKFYKSTTGGSLGTNTATIDTDGNFDAANNIFGATGIACRNGFSGSGRSGLMGVYHFANSVYAELFSYNYTAGTFKDILIGDTLLVQGGVKNVGIGISNPSSDIIAYPFVVNKSISSSISGGYGYLSISGSGSSTNTGSVPVSIYCSARIFCTEVDCYSDRRKKKNIKPIDNNLADRFIDEVEAVEFEWKNDGEGKRTGYIAQQILGTGLFPDLVTFHEDSKMIGDDQGSPGGYSLSVQYNNVAAILHQAIKNLKGKVKTQESRIQKNEETIESLVSTVQYLKDLLSLRL